MNCFKLLDPGVVYIGASSWCCVVSRESGLVPRAPPQPPGGQSRPARSRSCQPSGAEGGSPRRAPPGVGCWGVGRCCAPSIILTLFIGSRPAPQPRRAQHCGAAQESCAAGLSPTKLLAPPPRPQRRPPAGEVRVRPAQPLLT